MVKEYDLMDVDLLASLFAYLRVCINNGGLIKKKNNTCICKFVNLFIGSDM